MRQPKASLSQAHAVARCARATGLDEHLEEATSDVTRALDALARDGVSAAPVVRLEYPVGLVEDGRLVTGYIDLVTFSGDCGTVIDFKTDRAARGTAQESHPQYVAQVGAYVRMLVSAGVAGATKLRGGLLWD
jgi:ATP-dependent exoDNAse (exonuclease V) beta subunit